MTSPVQSSDLDRLLDLIENNDAPKVQALLTGHPESANALVDEPRLYQSKILHWLYANDTPLHLAAAGHRSQIVRNLLKTGADANAAQNHRKGRPLHYAADSQPGNPIFDPREQVKTLTALIKASAQIDAADKNGATALHRAVRTRGAAAVECLLKAGANPAAKNNSGSTPLHLAVQTTGRGGSGHEQAKLAQPKIIQLLLSHGADPKAKDESGKSVFDWATSDEIRELLRKKS